MNEIEAVLAANEAFYRAFAERDLSAMDTVWAEKLPVACIHPGWEALVGRDAVMTSWTQILGSPSSPDIHCEDENAYLLGEIAFVLCVEVIGEPVLVATNVFGKEDGRWRMVHHHASPIPHLGEEAEEAEEEEEEEEEPPRHLH